MALHESKAFRCLEKKTLIMGFEVVDVFVVFAALSVLNVIFSGVPNKFIWTWGPSMALGAFLRIVKAGKPDNYLLHLMRFHLSPGVLNAFELSRTRVLFVKKG